MSCVDCPDMPNGTRKRATCCRRTGAELVSDRIPEDPMGADFIEGYLDGRDRNAPAPSANRSHSYRHSFAVGRAEIEGKPRPAAITRIEASEAAAKDIAA